MHVLFDTNVLVTILIRREGILRFKAQFASGDLTHITSRYIINEVEYTLPKLQLTKPRTRAAARLLAKYSTVVKPKRIDKVVRDPNDDAILAAAVEGSTDYLVSTDKDLLVLKEYKGIRIITLDQWNAIVNNR